VKLWRICLVAAALGMSFAVSQPVFAAAEVQKFVFVSPPQTISLGAVSEQITIQAQDSAGSESKVLSTACAALSSSSSGGEFSSSATDWSLVSALTIAKNSANRNFYYTDRAVGTHTLNAKVVLRPEGESRSCASWPREEWPSGWETEQRITIGASGASYDTSSSSSSPSNTVSAPATASQGGNSGSTAAEYKPQIYVSAFVPERSVAGAPALFDAEAVGLKKEPLLHARYVWSFGDGGSAEGKKVYHTYHYPASYTVLVSASSGEWSATDRREIVIDAPELVIANLQEGTGGFIEVRNNGAHDVDLSFWILKVASSTFVIPNGTIVGAKKAIPFPAQITGLLAGAENTALLYPNGNVTVLYKAQHAAETEAPFQAPVAAPVPTTPEKATSGTSVMKSSAPPAQKAAVSAPDAAIISASSISSEQSSQARQSAELLGAAGKTDTRGMLPWLLGVVLLLFIAVGGYLALLRPPQEPSAAEKLQKEAAEYDLVE